MGVVANLVVKVSANTSDFEKAMAGLEKSMGRMGAKLQTVGAELTKNLTLPLVAVGGLSVKAAKDFESSFAGIRKTVDGVVDAGGNLTNFGKQLETQFRDLAKEIPISVNELNRIGESAGQLGIKSESIIDFTKTIAAMGVATNMTTEQAADGMARFANITQMPQEKIGNLGSVIVELGNKLAATESEILDFGLRIAGAGEIVGLTESQIMGIAGAFSSVGIEAEAGGTAVQKALLGMQSAVTTGKGLGAFGGAAFAQQFKADPGAAFASFLDTVGAAGKGGEQVLRNAGIDDARQIRAFLSMAAAGDLLRNSLKMAGDEWQRNTALTKEAEQRYRTFESQLILLKNRMYDVGITIGQSLIQSLLKMQPAIESVGGAIAGAANWFSNLPTPVQTAALGLAGFAAALGPLVYVIGSVYTTGSALYGLLGKLSFASVAAQVPTLAGAVSGLTNTFVLGFGRAEAFALTLKGLGYMAGIAAAAFVGWQLGSWIGDVTGATDAVGRMITKLGEWVGLLEKGSTESYDAMRSAQQLQEVLAAEGIKGRRTGDIALSSDDNPLAKFAGDAGALKKLQAEAASTSLGKATKHVDEFEQAVGALTARLGGSDVIASANQWVVAIDRIGGISRLTGDELDNFTKDISAAVEKMRALGQEVPRTWALIADTQKQMAALQSDRDYIAQSMNGGKMNRQQMYIPGGERTDYGLMSAPSAGTSHNVSIPGQTYGQQFVAGFSSALNDMPTVIMKAVMGGGDIGRSLGALFGKSITEGILGEGPNSLGAKLSKQLSGMFGSSIGSALASAIPGIGAMLGPLIGKMFSKLGGWIKGLFGNDEEAKDVNPARDAFLAQHGGFMELAAQLTSLTGEAGGGALFEALRLADTMQAFKAATDAIEQRLAAGEAAAASALGGAGVEPTGGIPIDSTPFAGAAEVNVTINSPVTINARYVTTEDEWIGSVLTRGILNAISNGGESFSVFEHLVSQATPVVNVATDPAIP